MENLPRGHLKYLLRLVALSAQCTIAFLHLLWGHRFSMAGFSGRQSKPKPAGFGNSYEKLFASPVQLKDEHFELALAHARSLEANLGGTAAWQQLRQLLYFFA